MTGRRTAHMIGMLLVGAASGLALRGWVRLPIAMLCATCLILLVSAEAARIATFLANRKAKP